MSLRRGVVHDVRSIEENYYVEEGVTRMSPKRKKNEDFVPFLMVSEITTSPTKATTQSSEVVVPFIADLNRAFSQDWLPITMSPKSSPIKKKSLCSFLQSFLNKNTCLMVGAITLVLFLATIIIKEEFSSTYRPSPIPHDYSDLQSMYDLKIGQVDHWCLGVSLQNMTSFFKKCW
jgi:hypothetical protein